LNQLSKYLVGVAKTILVLLNKLSLRL